jgi:TPR repeat protein
MSLFGGTPKLDRALDAFERRDWRHSRRVLESMPVEKRRAAGDYHLGILYWRGLGGKRNAARAVECFERAAGAGHPAAETAYGIALRSGFGAPKDNEHARSLFRSAAGAGDRDAMVQLATMSEVDEARRWLLRASELGHAGAMLHLADMLMRDDPVEALTWLYASVALSGNEAARKRGAALAREMTAAEIDAAQKAGRVYARDIQQRVRGK